MGDLIVYLAIDILIKYIMFNFKFKLFLITILIKNILKFAKILILYLLRNFYFV